MISSGDWSNFKRNKNNTVGVLFEEKFEEKGFTYKG